jgi:hypothetical protein
MRLIGTALTTLVLYGIDRAFPYGQPTLLSLPALAPWRNLSWGLFLPLTFAANVVVASLAWIIVWLIIR